MHRELKTERVNIRLTKKDTYSLEAAYKQREDSTLSFNAWLRVVLLHACTGHMASNELKW